MGEYGVIFFPLTTKGSAKPKDALAADRMPVADAQGRLNYERTFPADMVPEGLVEHLSELHVVQHGIDHNKNGKYDLEALGPSTFAENAGKTGAATGGGDQPGGLWRRPGRRRRGPGARWCRDRRSAGRRRLNAPLAAGGAALLLAAADVLFWRRPFRAAGPPATGGRPRRRAMTGSSRWPPSPPVRVALAAGLALLGVVLVWTALARPATPGTAVVVRRPGRACVVLARVAGRSPSTRPGRRGPRTRPICATRRRVWCCRSPNRWRCPSRGSTSGRGW